MKRDYTFLFLGIWVAVLPFLGFPPSWKRILFVITGLFIISIAYIIWYERLKKEKEDNQTQNQQSTQI